MKPFAFIYFSMVAFCFSFAGTLVAQPYVIFDSGDTVSTAPYIAVLLNNQQDPQKSDFYLWFAKQLPGVIIDDEDKKPSELFPLVTELSIQRLLYLSPQFIPLYIPDSRDIGRDIDLATLPSPICVIGADDKSLEWIVKKVNMLKRIKAHCLLVSAPDVDKARLVLNALGSVPLLLADGDMLGDFFKFESYPIVISREDVR